jgi:3-phytase
LGIKFDSKFFVFSLSSTIFSFITAQYMLKILYLIKNDIILWHAKAMKKSHIARLSLSVSLIIGLSACSHSELISDSKLMPIGAGTPVLLSLETASVGTRGMDAADDPEIWVDPKNPNNAYIIATDKKAGLYVYGLDGKVVDHAAMGPLNNVDLRQFEVMAVHQTLIAASDRAKNGAQFFTLTQLGKLQSIGFLSLPTSEAYGLCLGRTSSGLKLAIIGKNGDVVLASLEAQNGGVKKISEERFVVGSQSEGCVFDDVTGRLFIGEEAKGIWVYDSEAPNKTPRHLMAAAPGPELIPDVEGLSILVEPDTNHRYLLASSQGDSAFAVWRIDTPKTEYKGRFSLIGGRGIDPVTGTDGIAAKGGQIGPFSQGLIVVQDDAETDGEANGPRTRQNYKLADWAEIKSALFETKDHTGS